MEGLNIVGIQFRRAGKIYDFSSADHDLVVGDKVVVETDKGTALGQVAVIRFEDKKKSERPLKPILRRASRKELERPPRLTPEEVTSFTKEQVESLELNMKVLKSEVQFGGNKVIVFFTAPGRVDFRELVKKLAGGLKTRVELKQVGARDETKILGGVGICGREYCCSSFLREFVPVSIKMAKNQNLALNPSKVSGGCGRLLCCLTYENDAYTDLRRRLPPKGTKVRVLETGDIGEVVKSDLLNQLVLLAFEDGSQESYKLRDTKVVDRSGAKSDISEPEDSGDDWGEDLDVAELESYVDEIADKKVQSKNAPRGNNYRRQDSSRRGKHPNAKQGSQKQNPRRQDSSAKRSGPGQGKNNQDRNQNQQDGRGGNERSGKKPGNRGNRRGRKKPGNRPNKPKE